ncbi:TlpA disulfide reductase family protein [Flavivirga rizhaonensis]|uniref:AhpC/TSA family protein n=1 Tax=Flavivirga rizhaonensis TaxID=2559571 RepID=A0A4S1E2B6_9FLAO|nr:TlpA disulfide reductase family protein [Flavivirga rizhaonensis]TGV04881.1 AhpC/TSA family protein [Flavivirga rizhaonensis]
MKTLLKIKYLVISLFIIILTVINCKEDPKHDGFTISGTINGLDSGWVKLIKPRVFFTDTITVLDSTEIKNGKFTFKGKVDHVDYVQLNLAPRLNAYFFLENSPITLDVNIDNAEKGSGYIPPIVTGSKTQDLYDLQRAKIDSIRGQNKYLVFKKQRQDVIEAKRTNDKAFLEQVQANMVASESLEDELQEELKKYKIQFLKENPSSPVSVHIFGITFSEIVMNREEMKAVYSLFQGDALKANRFRALKKTYEDYIEKFAIGATVPDFTLKTLEGNDLTLSKVKGDYILVDFWASWCIPCRASFPHLKDIYNKYKTNGFEVVAVATGDKDDKWRKAIEKDQTVWKHVFDTAKDSKGKNGDIADAYGVPYLPTTYLLDNNRKIIGRNLSKKELEIKLEELFGY